MANLVAPSTYCDNDSFQQKVHSIFNAPYPARYMLCQCHSTPSQPSWCPLDQGSDFDTAGLPCQPNSRAGSQEFENDPRFVVYILWALLHSWRGTLVLILENVKVSVLVLLMIFLFASNELFRCEAYATYLSVGNRITSHSELTKISMVCSCDFKPITN